MRILLTGGAGYIGSHVLLGCIEAGHEVEVLDSLENGSAKAVTRVGDMAQRRIPLHRADVRDSYALDQVLDKGKFDAVMHFAGLKSVNESVDDPLRYYDYNLGGTATLCAAMKRHGVARLVFSSTAAVYGDQPVMPVTEESRLGPTSPYGWTKLMVEQMLEQHCASHPHWSVAVLRYFNPVGAHPSGQIGEAPQGVPANLVPYVMQVAAGQRTHLSVYGNDYPTPDGTGIRDYIHVMDLAEGHLAALERIRDMPGRHIWNLGTGKGHSVLEMVAAFRAVSGIDLPYRIEARRPGDLAQCWADPARARMELGWSAQRGLTDMLADHWRWQQMNPRGYTLSE
jgi:UDP-glucose 4-epimerase